jgi:hypothetical protein
MGHSRAAPPNFLDIESGTPPTIVVVLAHVSWKERGSPKTRGGSERPHIPSPNPPRCPNEVRPGAFGDLRARAIKQRETLLINATRKQKPRGKEARCTARLITHCAQYRARLDAGMASTVAHPVIRGHHLGACTISTCMGTYLGTQIRYPNYVLCAPIVKAERDFLSRLSYIK